MRIALSLFRRAFFLNTHINQLSWSGKPIPNLMAYNNKSSFLAQFHVSSCTSGAEALLPCAFSCQESGWRSSPYLGHNIIIRLRVKDRGQTQITQLPLKLLLGGGIHISIGWSKSRGQGAMGQQVCSPHRLAQQVTWQWVGMDTHPPARGMSQWRQ